MERGLFVKKFIGILSVFFILIASANICSAARDVYVCTNYDGEDIYVDIDSIRGWPEEFQANITVGTSHYSVVFVTKNGMIMCGGRGHSPGIVKRGTPIYQVYQFCKARVRSVYE